MKKIKITLATTLFIVACQKGAGDATRPPDTEPLPTGDSIQFKQSPHPQRVTEDPNRNYLFGDSVWMPKEGKLTKIGLNVLNPSGVTARCKLIVNGVEIRSIGTPTYDSISADSVFLYHDTVTLPQGWNFVKFTGFTYSPAKNFFKLYSWNIHFIDGADSVQFIGLPLIIERKWN
jgi:hypothetical protein